MPALPTISRLAFTLCLTLALTGCVRRTICITSDPSGALVYLNDREVGRTPLDVDFVHYGTYDVRLVKDGYESLLTFGDAEAPLWDLPGPDLIAELLPMEVRSNIGWHYVLHPKNDDRDALLDRARRFRDEMCAEDTDAADEVRSGE